MPNSCHIHKTEPDTYMEKRFPFHIINMCCLNENVCYNVVTNFQVLSYPNNNLTDTTQTYAQL